MPRLCSFGSFWRWLQADFDFQRRLDSMSTGFFISTLIESNYSRKNFPVFRCFAFLWTCQAQEDKLTLFGRFLWNVWEQNKRKKLKSFAKRRKQKLGWKFNDAPNCSTFFKFQSLFLSLAMKARPVQLNLRSIVLFIPHPYRLACGMEKSCYEFRVTHDRRTTCLWSFIFGDKNWKLFRHIINTQRREET